MSESVGHFYRHLPWNFITKFHRGVVVHKDGALQRTFAYRAPDIDSSGADEVNDFAVRLGHGWAFQFEAQRSQVQGYRGSSFDRLAPYLIDRERGASFSAAGRHFDSSYYLTFIWKPPSENAQKLAAVSFNRHPIRFPHTRIMLDRILPDSELVTSLTMSLGGLYIPIIGVNDFPDESYPAILDSLNRARLEYRWVTRYICLGKEEGLREARKKEKAHRGSRKTFFQTFAESTSGEPAHAVNHGAGVKESDSISAGIEIDGDLAALGYLTTCVMVWDADLGAARKKADLVKTVINGRGFTCKEETFNALEAFKSMLPGNACSNYRALPVMTNTMSHIVPLSSVWAGSRGNAHAQGVTGVGTPHVICSTVEGTPFFLNLNVGDVGHSAVWGPTGAGKSTLLNLLEMQAFKYPGSLVVVFDKGRSCRQCCLAAGGLFYEPAAENAAGVCFQPLRDIETDRGLMDAIEFIEACIAVNGYAVTPPMSAAVKESLELMRGIPAGRRTLTTFVQYSNYRDPQTGRPAMGELLGDYLLDGGKYGKIFDAGSSALSSDTRFLAIEMEALMGRGEACVVPALVYLFGFVEKKFDGRLALLVLDEAWLFLKNEAFADKIAEWLKVLRKKNVYVVFATQDLSDVAGSPLKATVLQQCLTKIYLADPSAQTPLMAGYYEGFGLSGAEISLISGAAMKRGYFYASPAGRRLFQLDLGPLALALIGQPDHALLDSLASRYEPGSPLCAEILSAKGIGYGRYLGADAPEDPAPQPRGKPPPAPAALPQDGPPRQAPGPHSAAAGPGFLEAAASLPDRKGIGGSGRAAADVAARFGVSVSTVYQARAVLRHGPPELAEALRRGDLQVKTAYRSLLKWRGAGQAG